MKLLQFVPFVLLLGVGVAGCGDSKDKLSSDKSAELGSAIGRGSTIGSASGSASASGALTGDSTLAATTPDQTKLLADLGSVKDEVCACHDRACVEKAIEVGSKFDARLDTMYEDEASISNLVKAQVDAIQHGIEACTTRIGGANAPLSAATVAILAEFDALADKICTCSDRACADLASAKGAELETKLEATFKTRSDIPEEAMSRMAATETRSQACVEKLRS